MKFTQIERIEIRRIRLEDGFYVDVKPAEDCENIFEFYLNRVGDDMVVFMFGCAAESDDEIIALVEANAEDYISTWEDTDVN